MNKQSLVTRTVLAFAALTIGAGWAAAQDVTLTFWSWRTEDVDGYRQIIAEFEEANPGIHVQFIPYRNVEYNTIVETALRGGRGPDIVHLRAYGGMEPLANAGFLTPLDGVIAELDDFDPGVLRGATNRADGRVYGVPFALQTVQVLYHRGIFEEHGLSEPATWDEFIELAETLQELGVTPFANGAAEPWTVETFFGAVAPNFYGCDAFYNEVVAGETTFEDPRFREGLERMIELVPYLPANYMGIGYTDMQAMFAFEQAAMLLGGSYEFNSLAGINADLDLGVFPVPPDNEGDTMCMTVYMDGSYGVNAATDHPEEALKFAEFTATREFGQMFTDILSQISAVPGVEPTDPRLAEVIELNERYGTPYLMLTAFRFGQPSGSTLLQNEMQSVLAGDKDLDEAIRNIQRGIAEWHEPFQE